MLKNKIESFFKDDFKQLWDFLGVPKLNCIIDIHLKELNNMREIINEIFSHTIESIVKSIKDGTDFVNL